MSESELLDAERNELLRIVRKAETAMQDPDTLLNTDLELEAFDQLCSEFIDSIDNFHKEHTEIIAKEDELRRELQQLVDEETELQSALKDIRIYKPKHPKRYKVTLFLL
jgi:vacuolar-type H+-ATPase subunit I/STV1